MANYNKYKPVHKPVSLVDQMAYEDYKKWSKKRDWRVVGNVNQYKGLSRKIWKKIAEYSVQYESGVYSENFFYLIPQVIDNKPFVQLKSGRIKSNDFTNGDMYAPIFCNLMKKFSHFTWSLDGSYVDRYKERLTNIINEVVPKYYFILSIIKNNKF